MTFFQGRSTPLSITPCHSACNGQIPVQDHPPGFPNVTYDSWTSQANYGHGGVIVTLLMRPSGDPSFGG